MLDNPKITWREAQKKLDSSQVTILNQIARMKEADKAKWAEFNKNDWKSANKSWQALASKNPEQKEQIKRAQRLAQLKMVYGKDILSDKKKKEINSILSDLTVDADDDFGQYWGY